VNLVQISTFFEPKNRAAHVDAHAPLTHRSRTAHVAAHVDAHVDLSKCPESDLFAPTDMLGCLENIAPQKRS